MLHLWKRGWMQEWKGAPRHRNQDVAKLLAGNYAPECDFT